MENENKTIDHVKDATINVKNIEWEVTKSRLVIETDTGRITCKPKKEGITYIRGIKVIDSVPMEVTDLPPIVFELQEKANKNGSVTVIGSYSVMVTEKDGQEQKYRFTTLGMLLKWSDSVAIAPEPNKTPRMSDVVNPTTPTEKAINEFLHKKELLKEKISLGMLDVEEYEEQVKALKQQLLNV